MPTYTPKQAAALLRLVPGALTQAVETEQVLATIDLEGDIKQRVFNDGKNRAGGKIGTYSTEEIWLGVDAAKARYGSQIPTSKLKPRGKPLKGKKRGSADALKRVDENGQLVMKPRRTQYFSEGYSGFRAFMGREVSSVNLKLTGNLSNSIASGTEGNVSTIAFTNEKAAKIAEGNEKRFGGVRTIFKPSDGEVDELGRRLREAAQKALDRIFT